MQCCVVLKYIRRYSSPALMQHFNTHTHALFYTLHSHFLSDTHTPDKSILTLMLCFMKYNHLSVEGSSVLFSNTFRFCFSSASINPSVFTSIHIIYGVIHMRCFSAGACLNVHLFIRSASMSVGLTEKAA